MADAPDRKNQATLLNTLAQRVIGRFQQTPMNSMVQRAIQPSRSEETSPLNRATATAGFVQRVTSKTHALVWKPRATTKQEAIEGFTDTLIQRFPDFSAKYIVRSADNNSTETPMQMVYPGEPPQPNIPEESSLPPSFSDVPTSSSNSTFDVNSLPSIPAEIVARHKAEAQQRAASSGTKGSGVKSPRAIQRQSASNEPQLVRPRSKVDYIGSKPASGAISPISTTPTPPVPESTVTNAPVLPLQAKADESVIQETTPLEEPKWRTRPRAGFQSLPTKASAQESSSAVPFAPIQVDTPLQAKTNEAPETPADITPTTATSSEPSIESAPYKNENTGDDASPTDSDSPPDQPPPPSPPSFPSSSGSVPVQRTAQSDSPVHTVEMPLRVPPTPPAVSGTWVTDSDGNANSTSSLPSLSLGVPAKAIRRTSQAAPILRKPILPNSARSLEGTLPPASDSTTKSPATGSTVAQPHVSPTIMPLQPKAQGEDRKDTVVQLKNDFDNLDVNISSLHEDNNTRPTLEPLSTSKDVPVVGESITEGIPPGIGFTTPIQQVADATVSSVAGPTIETFTTTPNSPESAPPDREAMPLRVLDALQPPIQQQTDDMESLVTTTLSEGVEDSSTTIPLPTPPLTPVPPIPTSPAQAEPHVLSSLPGASPSQVTDTTLPLQPTFQPVQRTTANVTSTGNTPIQRTLSGKSKDIPVTSTNTPPGTAAHETVSITPNAPVSFVPEREAMPLRAESNSPDPLQSRPEQEVAGTVSITDTVRESVSNPAPTNKPNSEITTFSGESPLQRVAHTPSASPTTAIKATLSPVEAPPSTTETAPTAVDSTPQTTSADSFATPNTGNHSPSATTPIEPTINQSREPIQRVVAEPSSAPLHTQTDMPLRVETGSSSKEEPETQKEDIPPVSAPATVESITSLPVASGITEKEETTASPTSSITLQRKPEEKESELASDGSVTFKDESIQEVAGELTRSGSEPLPRVNATIAPSVPILPAQADMPVRHDATKPSETIQRQADVDETDDTIPSVIKSASASEVQPTLPVVVESSKSTREPATEPLPRQSQPDRDTTLTQRVEAEIVPPTLPIPSQTEMPLRQEHTPVSQTAPTVQRRTAPESIAKTEAVAESESEIPTAHPTTNQPSATAKTQVQHSVNADDSPAPAPIQREQAESDPPPQPHHTEINLFVAKEDSPVQRVSAEIEPPFTHYPAATETEMPLREASSRSVSASPIQQVSEVQAIQNPEPEGAETPKAPNPSVSPGTTPPIVQREILPDGSAPSAHAQIESSKQEAEPLQRVAVQPTVPSQSTPTRADMPLHIESGNPNSAPLIERTSDAQSGKAEKTISTAEDVTDVTTDITSSVLPDVGLTSHTPITIQRKPYIENNNPLADKAEPIQQVQRVILESNQSSPATPSRDDMPLRVGETTSISPIENKRLAVEDSITSENNIEGASPIQRSVSEATTPPTIETHSTRNDILDVTSTRDRPAPISTESGSSSSSATAQRPVQRVSVEVAPPESSMPHREEMPLHAAPPSLQLKSNTEPEHNDLAELTAQATTPTKTSETLLLQSDGLQAGLERTLPRVAEGKAILPPDETPVAQTTATPSAPIQRKTTVKATRIQRRTTPIVQREAMPVAPQQTPLQRHSGPIAQPDLPVESVETTLERTGSEALPTTLPVPAIVQRTATMPFAAPSEADTPLRVLTDTSHAQRQPITPATAPIQRTGTTPIPSTSAPVTMPLVQRVQTSTTTTDTENDEEYMDLHALLDDEAETSDGNSQTNTVGGTNKKEPTESDAMRALETLAREIYPLLKQMIARERERHRGF
jgi:hypothetical protein